MDVILTIIILALCFTICFIAYIFSKTLQNISILKKAKNSGEYAEYNNIIKPPEEEMQDKSRVKIEDIKDNPEMMKQFFSKIKK